MIRRQGLLTIILVVLCQWPVVRYCLDFKQNRFYLLKIQPITLQHLSQQNFRIADQPLEKPAVPQCQRRVHPPIYTLTMYKRLCLIRNKIPSVIRDDVTYPIL